jgi:hypothetical protein
MPEPEIVAYVGLDVVSMLLASWVAFFFLRSHRIDRRQSFGVLAAAFAILAVSHLSTALAGFDVYPNSVLPAIRTGGVFLATVLIFLAYAFRSRQTATRTVYVVAAGGGLALVALVGAYALAGSSLASPLIAFPWLRLIDGLLLLSAAAFAAVGVHVRSFHDLKVPSAFVFLALSRYTSAILGFQSEFEPSPLAYAWRLLALVLLASVVPRRWPHPPT